MKQQRIFARSTWFTAVSVIVCLGICALIALYFFGDDSPTRIRDRTAWSATATHHPGAALLAFDGDLQTRWTTQQPLEPGMF
ncbi:hypothetical protein GF339_11060, partial [candidate division KSB3 bacterium]|nr:hypothetical protein [candidate division KSB3 bacterium]MBD3325115.1 hypothetical protein [candidate division KSB3 bacterium]